MATIQPRNPVQIFNVGADEQKQESARVTAYSGAIAVADLVKTTLGPKGMDKILQSMDNRGDIQVTNDGATILKSLYIDNPASKIIVDVSKSQDNEVGDGTTSVVVLAGELLREADLLVGENIHPQTIITGWRKAVDVAREALDKASVDNSEDKEKFNEDLMNIARTTLSSKAIGHGFKEKFTKMAVDAVLRLKGSTNLEMIHYIKHIGSSLADSYLDEGFVLNKTIGVGQPKRIENAKILVANTAMDHDKIKIFGATVQAESPDEVAAIEKAERDRMLTKCEKISKHGINCFINRQLIYNLAEQFFADHGVCAIEHADFEGIERLAFVTGGDIVSTFDSPDSVTLGECDLIEEVMIGERKMIRFSGCKRGEACTIILRGPTKHLLDEAQRSFHDAVSVLSQVVATEKRTVLGAGCSEMVMAQAVDKLAKATPGKESIAIESFAKALRKIPTIIADNGGYDTIDLIAALRAAHFNGETTMGLDMANGEVADVKKLAIVESFKVKCQVLLSAAEAAEMILRIDEVIRSAPRKRQEDPRYGH